MSEYTGRERIRAAYKREYADRVPFYPLTGAAIAKFAGFTVREFLTEPAKLVKSTLAFYESYHPDLLVVATDTILDAEAFGNELEFPEDTMPYTKKRVLEDKANLAKLDVPDPMRDGRLPGFLEACEQVASAVKDSAVSGFVNGPWVTASHMRGMEELIYDTVDDPDFVHRLMRLTTEMAKKFAAAQRDVGVGLGMGEAASSCSLISPDIYRTFIKPYHQEIIDYFQGRRIPFGLHICGYIDPIMEDVASTGVASLSIDAPSSLKKLMEIAQGRTVVIGNVPTPLFLEGTREQMEAAVKECIETGAQSRGYILCSGCEVPVDSPLEGLQYFKDAALKYGSYA